MMDFRNYETIPETETKNQPDVTGDSFASFSRDTDSLNSTTDVLLAGDTRRNGTEGSDLMGNMEIPPTGGFPPESTDYPNDVPEDVPADEFESEPTDNYPDNIPEDTDSASDIKSVSDITGWLGDINPNYDEFDVDSPYSNNCGSCAYAVYQRMEGSADACASENNIPYNEDMEALTGMEQVSMDPSEIEQRLLEQGDGAHAIIGIDRAEGPGHWFNAACVDGKVVAIDGQSGEITDWPPDYGDVINWEMSVKKGE